MTTSAEKATPTFNLWAWPDFNPAYRVARCGDTAAHGPHVMEHGPDQPRNCPGTGQWVACPACAEMVPVIPGFGPAAHQIEGQWCQP